MHLDPQELIHKTFLQSAASAALAFVHQSKVHQPLHTWCGPPWDASPIHTVFLHWCITSSTLCLQGTTGYNSLHQTLHPWCGRLPTAEMHPHPYLAISHHTPDNLVLFTGQTLLYIQYLGDSTHAIADCTEYCRLQRQCGIWCVCWFRKGAPPLITPSHPPDNATPIHESKAIATNHYHGCNYCSRLFVYCGSSCSKWPDNRPEDH